MDDQRPFTPSDWFNPANGREITTGTLISDIEEVLHWVEGNQQMGVEHDFSTTDLVEWWTTVDMHLDEGFHTSRGTPIPEIDLTMGGLTDVGIRSTTLPEIGIVWNWPLIEDPATLWDSVYQRISGNTVNGEVFDEDPDPFDIEILIDIHDEDPDALMTQVVFLRYQHVEEEFWRVIIMREVNSDGSYVDWLYEEPIMIPTNQTHVFEHEFLEEWFVTSELPYTSGPTWEDVLVHPDDLVFLNEEDPVVIDPGDLLETFREETGEDIEGGVLYIRLEMVAPEFWEVIITQVRDHEGNILSEIASGPTQLPFVPYTNEAYEWFVSTGLPPVPGPTWEVVLGQPQDVEPVQPGPAIFDPTIPPFSNTGGTIYLL